MTLAEFLLARIAEDEARAVAAMPTGARRNGKATQRRVLAECEAKRRIIDECTGGLKYDVSCGEGHWWNFKNILGILALPYANHPDCLPEWKP